MERRGIDEKLVWERIEKAEKYLQRLEDKINRVQSELRRHKAAYMRVAHRGYDL